MEAHKIQMWCPRVSPERLADGLQEKSTRNVVQRMVKHNGVRLVDVQRPRVIPGAFTDNHVAGVPLAHLLRRQRDGRTGRTSGFGPEPHPGVRGGVHHSSSCSPCCDAIAVHIKPCADMQFGRSARSPLQDVHIKVDMNVCRSAGIARVTVEGVNGHFR